MKITTSSKPNPNPNPNPTPSDLPKKPLPRRKLSRNTPRQLGPTTPLLKWNFLTTTASAAVNVVGDTAVEGRRKLRREKDKGVGYVSARKLGAVLWRMQSDAVADMAEKDGGGGEEKRLRRRRRERRNDNDDNGDGGFKTGIGHGVDQLSCRHGSRECGSQAKDPLRSPCSVNGPVNGYHHERQSPFQYSNYAMEGATKWDPVGLKESDESPDDENLVDQKANASLISALEAELEQARTRIEELEVERRSSKKKVEHFLKKLSEERAAWRSREHEKVRAIIDDIKSDLNRERKNRQRLEKVHSKLVNDLSELKLSAKRYMQDYEKERKARVLIEEVCDELAKEIGEDKAEVDSLKKECMKIREEVDDERKMLQMAEVWREERVQMKLVDAKVALDQKYSQMNYLVEELQRYLKSKGVALDPNELKEGELFQRAAASMNIQDMKEFVYEPSNSDDIYAIVEEMAMAETTEREREIEPCIEYSHESRAPNVQAGSPEINSHSKDIHRLSNMYGYPSGEIDDDVSGWETVSHAEDQGSSYSAEGSIMSVNRMCRDSNVSGSCTDWEEQVGDGTPITEISEVCSVTSKQSKKVKSISRLWRSGHNNGGDNYKTIPVDGVNGRLSNGRVSVSNGAVMSPDRGSGKDGFSPSDKIGWSSPESGNPHINRGMKGCIEWPRGAQRSSLKNKLLEARMESQKVQLRQVLKQKI